MRPGSGAGDQDIVRPEHRRHLYTFLHHLLLATTISSALVVLESWPKFQAVDNRTHFALSYVRARLWTLLPSWFPGQVLPPDRYPLVLVLDAQPRSQAKALVADLVETVSAEWATRPEKTGRGVLAFEVELEPSEHDRQAEDQDILDRALDAAARNKIGVVLWLPDFRTGPESLHRARLGWMQARCAAGVRFAVEEPRPAPEAVHSYWKNYPSIGVVAARAGSSGPPPEPPTAHVRGRLPDYDICTAAKSVGRDVRLFFDRLRQSMPSPGLEHETPLNSSFFQYSGNVYDAEFNPARPWPTPEAIRSAPAIFVGALTPERGTFFGYTIPTMAALYAAEFFTEWNPVKPVGRWTAFGFDVVLGLGLGYVFAFTWEAFARAEERLQDTRLFPVVRSLARKAGRYLVARALLLANLALLAGVLAGCVLLSGRMLESRSWLNPLPIVLGTSIDGLLHSRTRPDSIEPQTWRTFLTKRSDIVPQLAIIAWAIWHLVR
jgi:hypothetical protein